MLLNVAIFMWFGAICPWSLFLHNEVIPIYRLIPLGILILLFRRLPIVLALHKKIHQIEELKQAIFVGFFGPIGVSAIFYLYISLEFLREVTLENGEQRPDAIILGEVIQVVVWFLVICSIVVHGVSIPLGKLGIYLPRTISAAISSSSPIASPADSSDNLAATVSGSARDGDLAATGTHQGRGGLVARLTGHNKRNVNGKQDPSTSGNPLIRVGNRGQRHASLAEARKNGVNVADGANISAPMDLRLIGSRVKSEPPIGPSSDNSNNNGVRVSPGVSEATLGTQTTLSEGAGVVARDAGTTKDRTIKFGDGV